MIMSKYFSHGKLTAVSGKRGELQDILLRAAELVRPMHGQKLYIVSVEDDGDDVWVTEVWDSKKDHDASLQDAVVRKLIGEAMPLIASPPSQGQELTTVGGNL